MLRPRAPPPSPSPSPSPDLPHTARRKAKQAKEEEELKKREEQARKSTPYSKRADAKAADGKSKSESGVVGMSLTPFAGMSKREEKEGRAALLARNKARKEAAEVRGE